MKTKINFKALLLITIALQLSFNALSQAIYVHLYDDVWAVCPEGDKNGDGNLTKEDGCYHAIIKQSRSITGSGGGAGISIPVINNPSDPYTPPPGGNTSTPITPTNPTSGGGNTNTDPIVPKEIGDTTIQVLTPICKCTVCPDCGGCILGYGESLPSGCEYECIHCLNSFSFDCIENIRDASMVKTIETTLWNVALISFNLALALFNSDYILSILTDLFPNFDFSTFYINVVLEYQIGTLACWSGDLKYVCSSRIITTKSNEYTKNYNANLTDNANLCFYKVNLQTGEEQLVNRRFDTIEGNCISLEDIERDGIPKVGETIEKPYHHIIKIR